MKVIYIAGPFRAQTSWQIELNIHQAKCAAFEIWKVGHVAICPHANSGDFAGEPFEDSVLAGYREVVRRCDAVLLLPGWEASIGSLRERETAKDSNVPIFYHMDDLMEFLDSRNDT